MKGMAATCGMSHFNTPPLVQLGDFEKKLRGSDFSNISITKLFGRWGINPQEVLSIFVGYIAIPKT